MVASSCRHSMSVLARDALHAHLKNSHGELMEMHSASMRYKVAHLLILLSSRPSLCSLSHSSRQIL
jgi:hypothetical protein